MIIYCPCCGSAMQEKTISGKKVNQCPLCLMVLERSALKKESGNVNQGS